MSTNQQRVAMITGGNSGIGFATANKLAARGFRVILASRNQQSSAQAMARIRAGNPNASVESIPLEVRADWVRAEHPEVNVIAAMDDAPVDFDDPAAWDLQRTVHTQVAAGESGPQVLYVEHPPVPGTHFGPGTEQHPIGSDLHRAAILPHGKLFEPEHGYPFRKPSIPAPNSAKS